MPNYHITPAITITEENSQVTISEPIWHMALRVVKIFNITQEDSNRVAAIRFMRDYYSELSLYNARVIVYAAIDAITNKTHTPEHL
jgi:hypothetical protein